MSEKIDYRKIESSESKIFRGIRLEALKNYPESFGSLYEDEIVKPKLYFEDVIERGNSENIFFFGAFTSDGELIGIAGFVRETAAKSRHRGVIISMYVKPEFQGRKVGENLLQSLIKEAFETGGIEQLHLTVVAGNRAAVRLYERSGFKTFGVQKNFFKANGEYWDLQSMQLMKEDFGEYKNSFSTF